MLAHISIGVRDIARAKLFYDAALEPLGYRCIRAAQSMVGWGYGRETIARSGSWWRNDRFRPTRDRAFIFASRRLIAVPSMPFMPPHCAPAVATTAPRGCAPSTAPIITPLSSSIPRAIASRPFTATNEGPAPPKGAGEENVT